MTTKKVIQRLKVFFAWLAWRIGLPANEPVKCQCHFCAKWADIMKLKAFRRIQEEKEAESRQRPKRGYSQGRISYTHA